MNDITEPFVQVVREPYSALWSLLLVIPAIAIFTWYSQKPAEGEPPLIPSKIPWLGHGWSFMNDMNGFTEWARSLHPNSPACTVQVAGQHLYLVFDTKLASAVYRRSRAFIFDPFVLMTWGILGASKQDLDILEMGAQMPHPKPNLNDDGRRVIYDLHKLTPPHLTGESLDKLTGMFIDTLCAVIDRKFPATEKSSYEWVELDLCEYIKSIWTEASIIALFGTHILSIWPDLADWLWKFDKHLQSLLTKMPRFVIPTAYALREEGQKKCMQWEDDARAMEESGKFGEDPDWDPYWGLRFTRLRANYLKQSGLSATGRAGNQMAFIWGLNANAIPIAMQVMNQAVMDPTLLAELKSEIFKAQTGPTAFNMQKVITSPKLKSILLEALRWATASPSPRWVREDCELGEYRLKAGSLVIVHSRTLQMDDETWRIPSQPESAPSEFWAERFLDGDDEAEGNRLDESKEAEDNYGAEVAKGARQKIVEPISGPKSKEIQTRMLALRPFGGGTTLCPGRHFATNEILGGIAALMLRLDVEVIPQELQKRGKPMPDLSKQGGLFPDRPLMVRMRRRKV